MRERWAASEMVGHSCGRSVKLVKNVMMHDTSGLNAAMSEDEHPCRTGSLQDALRTKDRLHVELQEAVHMCGICISVGFLDPQNAHAILALSQKDSIKREHFHTGKVARGRLMLWKSPCCAISGEMARVERDNLQKLAEWASSG